MVKKWLQSGSPVRVRRLGSTEGWRVAMRHLRPRSSNAKGVILGPAFGHRRKVVLVEHDSGAVGAYHVEELAPA